MRPISGSAMSIAALASGMHTITMLPASADGDEPATVTFELEAADARHARIVAQHRLGEVQAAAGVAMHEASVVWVAPLLGSFESSHRFFAHARELLDEESFDLAVVAAQIHLEVQVRTLVRLAVASDPSALTSAIVARQRSWGPHDRWAQPIIEALFGITLTSYPGWREYKTHVKRRNDVVHLGQALDRESAEDSLRAVHGLWLWLNEAAQRVAAS